MPAGVRLINPETGKPEFILARDIEDRLASGWKEIPGETVDIGTDEGIVGVSPSDYVKSSKLGISGQVITGTAAEQQLGQQTFQRKLPENLSPGLLGDLTSASAGAVDTLAPWIGRKISESQGVNLRELDEVIQGSPTSYTLGQIAAVVGPGMLTGGTGALAGASRLTLGGTAARAGEAIAARIGAKSVTGKVLGSALGAAAEGAIVSGGLNLFDAINQENPDLLGESTIEAIGIGALFGAGIGGSLGLAGASLGRVSKRFAKTADKADDAVRSYSSEQAASAVSRVEKNLDELHQEVRLKAAMEPDIIAKGAPDFEVSDVLATGGRAADDIATGAGKVAARGKAAAKAVADVSEPIVISRPNPAGQLAIDIEKFASKMPANLSKVRPIDIRRLADEYDSLLLRADAVGAKLPKTEVDLQQARELIETAGLRGISPHKPGAQEFAAAWALNRLATEGSKVVPKSKAAGLFGVGSSLMNRYTGGILGKVWEAKNKVVKLVADMGGKTLRNKAVRMGTVAALHKISFDGSAPPKRETREAMMRRHAEALDSMARNPRQHSAHIPAVAQAALAHPSLGPALDEAIQKRIDYLASKVPKPPPSSHLSRSRWVPSDEQMREFQKFVDGAFRPTKFIEELRAGRVSPQTADTLRNLHSGLYQEIQKQLIEQAPDLTKNLDYADVVNISILFRIPLDATLEPGFIKTLQQNFLPAPPDPQAQGQQPQAQQMPIYSSISVGLEPTIVQRLQTNGPPR